jgi:hypothetical protein
LRPRVGARGTVKASSRALATRLLIVRHCLRSLISFCRLFAPSLIAAGQCANCERRDRASRRYGMPRRRRNLLIVTLRTLFSSPYRFNKVIPMSTTNNLIHTKSNHIRETSHFIALACWIHHQRRMLHRSSFLSSPRTMKSHRHTDAACSHIILRSHLLNRHECSADDQCCRGGDQFGGVRPIGADARQVKYAR